MLITIDTPEVQLYYAGCQRIYHKHLNGAPIRDEWAITQGKRYLKVTHNGSVHSFIDCLGGDVLKPGGYNKPAKHARGNIFDDHGGLQAMGPYGPAYLR